ncbi:hypothetical protein AB5I39_04500 [Sphingomonas sp. MMS24-J45]|uniref:hypothetical protein n=1 Tax=Sphingomonas sp. MMS24-J45 TaxID=3238806 RepID=UPI00384F1A5C
MTNAFDLFGVIIALNLVYFGWVLGFVAGSPKGLSAGKATAPAKSPERRYLGIGMIVLGLAFAGFSLSRLI